MTSYASTADDHPSTVVGAIPAKMALDGRRARTLNDLGTDEHIGGDHPGTTGVVAPPLSIARCRLLSARRRVLTLPSGHVKMDVKAFAPLENLSHRHSTIPWDGHASSAAGSDKLRSWFSG